MNDVSGCNFFIRSPTLAEDARRIVRHGMAEILDWLGEPVGPKPGEWHVYPNLATTWTTTSSTMLTVQT